MDSKDQSALNKITIDIDSTDDLTGMAGSGSFYTYNSPLPSVPPSLPPLTGGSGLYTSSSGYTYTTNNTGAIASQNSNLSWNTPWQSSKVTLGNNGIEMDESCDLKIGDISLKDFMQQMSDRLAILQPDPKKLEKFEALKQAYEHYKLLEKLCNETEGIDKK